MTAQENAGKTLVLTGAGNSGLDISGGGESTRKVVASRDAGVALTDALEANKKRVLIDQDATFMWRAYRLSPDVAANLMHQDMKDLWS